MNWVLRRHRRDQAIASQAENVWSGLCSAVKDSVDAYNENYNPPSPVVYDPNGKRMRISRKEKTVVETDPRLVPTKAIDLAFDQRGQKIVATSERVREMPKITELLIDADQQETVFLHLSGQENRLSYDEAAEKILRNVLFDD